MGEYAEMYMEQQMREAADDAIREAEKNAAPARTVFTDETLQAFAKEAGLRLSAPSPHHLQVRQDGALFAEWWPGKGTTRADGKRGPRCRTVADFIEWLKSF